MEVKAVSLLMTNKSPGFLFISLCLRPVN